MPSPKQEAIICHKIAALAYLLAEALDELNPEMRDTSPVKAHFEKTSELSQEIVNDMFGVPEIRTTTYLPELAEKVNTCIRKNYVRIPGTE